MRTRLSYDEALAVALDDSGRLQAEAVHLSVACGRVAAANMTAPFALPGFANSAMDGFAVRGVDLAIAARDGLPVSATVLAGDTAQYTLLPGTAMAIMTGAPMPHGADTVVIREQARCEGGRVWLPGDARVGGNVRPADDDCRADEPVLAAGEVLTPARVALLASFGLTTVEVVRQPRVAILTTGDELVAPGCPLGFGQRYDSNGPLLAGLVAAAGARVIFIEHCGDDPAALSDTLRRLSESDIDLLITCGGVSAGEADHLPGVIAELGEVIFWKLRMKPGMPALYGRIGDAQVFALPGNPVSVGVTFEVLVRPVIDRLLGRPEVGPTPFRARLSCDWNKHHPRLEFVRCTLSPDAAGTWAATPLAHQGSGALSALAAADALIRLDEGPREYRAGDLVQMQWLSGPER